MNAGAPMIAISSLANKQMFDQTTVLGLNDGQGRHVIERSRAHTYQPDLTAACRAVVGSRHARRVLDRQLFPSVAFNWGGVWRERLADTAIFHGLLGSLWSQCDS